MLPLLMRPDSCECIDDDNLLPCFDCWLADIPIAYMGVKRDCPLCGEKDVYLVDHIDKEHDEEPDMPEPNN